MAERPLLEAHLPQCVFKLVLLAFPDCADDTETASIGLIVSIEFIPSKESHQPLKPNDGQWTFIASSQTPCSEVHNLLTVLNWSD